VAVAERKHDARSNASARDPLLGGLFRALARQRLLILGEFWLTSRSTAAKMQPFAEVGGARAWHLRTDESSHSNIGSRLMIRNWFVVLSTVVCCTLTISHAGAVTITPDYSSLGTVYQDAAGQLYTAAGAGRSDVTATFKLDVSAAITYLQGAITLPWNESITFKLEDIGTDAVADSGIDTITGDAAKRPATSTIRFNTHTGFPSFIDPTPFNNSEFTMATSTAALGGGNVNNKRFGDATDAGGAKGRWDLLTLVLHETEHSLGISNGQSSGFTRFLDLVGAVGTDPRNLTIPKALSGLPNNFDIPIQPNSSHFIGDPTNNDTFGFAVVADPGWQTSQRALPTCLDILAIGQTEGATMAQINCGDLVPEPSTLILLSLGFVGFAGCVRRRG
jgi:PEP-CTERM motif